MSEAVAHILAQLGALSQTERAEIAYAFLESLEPEDPGAADAWDDELDRRVARIRGGQAVGIPAEQVLANWRQNRS
jgi:putative addiction module component (TIGR02574 family)